MIIKIKTANYRNSVDITNIFTYSYNNRKPGTSRN